MKQQTGPRRTGSVVSYRRGTRMLAFLALLACGAAVVSDDTNQSFWERHALLTGLAASVIVVMLTVAVVNVLNAGMYAEVIDRHVELAGDITWVAGLLDSTHPPADLRRQQRARSSPAIQIEGDTSGQWLADRLVARLGRPPSGGAPDRPPGHPDQVARATSPSRRIRCGGPCL
jgi:hypothetical protein